MDSVINYPTYWKRMEIFDYKCNILPLDIQKIIILKSENYWYNNEVDKIIRSWYSYIGKKIIAQYIYSKIEFVPIQVKIANSWNLSDQRLHLRYYVIDPLKNFKKIIYICKKLKGTEDGDFWKSFLEKVACGLKLLYKKMYKKIDLGQKAILNLSHDNISKVNDLIKINNYIVGVRDKFEFPISFGNFKLEILMGLKYYSFIPYYFN